VPIGQAANEVTPAGVTASGAPSSSARLAAGSVPTAAARTVTRVVVRNGVTSTTRVVLPAQSAPVPSAGKTTTPKASSLGSVTSSSTQMGAASTATHVAPGVPVVGVWTRIGPDGTNGSAPLVISSVSAGAGATLKSITVKYATGTTIVPLSAASSDYINVSVPGLVIGKEYSFTVEVCNSFQLCSLSAPVNFTPYNHIKVNAPAMLMVGANIQVTTYSIDQNYNPVVFACKLNVTSSLSDSQMPKNLTVPAASQAQFTWTPVKGATYTAQETCSGGGKTSGATSPALVAS